MYIHVSTYYCSKVNSNELKIYLREKGEESSSEIDTKNWSGEIESDKEVPVRRRSPSNVSYS